jgi:hypothetical protein
MPLNTYEDLLEYLSLWGPAKIDAKKTDPPESWRKGDAYANCGSCLSFSLISGRAMSGEGRCQEHGFDSKSDMQCDDHRGAY